MEKRIICNCCGKEIYAGKEIVSRDYLHVEKEWGYFSNKDGMLQEFNLCEECYDEWTSHFKIPILTTEVTELM